MSFLKAALTYATTSTPAKLTRVPHFELLSEKDAVRRQFLPDGAYEKLATETGRVGVWLRCLFELYFTFGWRRNEPLAFVVGQVDLQNRTLKLDVSKNGSRPPIRMTQRLYELVKVLCEGKKATDPLFTLEDGSPVGDFRKTWNSVCEAAGVGKLHIHDFRRTAARNLRRSGVSESVAMKIAGWKTGSIFKRYDIVDEGDITDAMAKVEQFHEAQAKAVVEKPSTQLNSSVQ